MLTHTHSGAVAPSRVVVLGGSGLIGRNLVASLTSDGVTVLSLGSRDIVLDGDGAGDALAARLQPSDALVFLSAVTRDVSGSAETMVRNIRMGINVAEAVSRIGVRHLVYLSSDAVYPFGDAPVTESSCAEPSDTYSAAHMAREITLRTETDVPLCVLRPTQICAPDDTHFAYGPNRFRKQAIEEGKITLFGEGEETRDHIMIDDVIRLIRLCLDHASTGTLNVATGRSLPFGEVAGIVASQFNPVTPIVTSERRRPITHRRFDVANLKAAFPDFTPVSVEQGVAGIHRSLERLPDHGST